MRLVETTMNQYWLGLARQAWKQPRLLGRKWKLQELVTSLRAEAASVTALGLGWGRDPGAPPPQMCLVPLPLPFLSLSPLLRAAFKSLFTGISPHLSLVAFWVVRRLSDT